MYELLNASAISAEKFALVVGNARSGTTIAGAIIDSHPQMLCANELSASATFWRGIDRDKILDNIIDNCRLNCHNNRPSENYLYGIKTDKKYARDIAVIGDKIWNPALLLMAGQRDLLASLQDQMGAQVVLIHCVRNPFDVIATMHRRSGASLRDRLGWYIMHCEAIQIIIEREEQPIFLLRHEELIEDPRGTSRRLFEWLGYPTVEEHLKSIQARVFPTPHQTRGEVVWSSDLIHALEKLCDRFAFLREYQCEQLPWPASSRQHDPQPRRPAMAI